MQEVAGDGEVIAVIKDTDSQIPAVDDRGHPVEGNDVPMAVTRGEEERKPVLFVRREAA